MTAGRDSRVRTTATFLASICWLKLPMNVSIYPSAVSNTVSQFGESTLQQDKNHRVVHSEQPPLPLGGGLKG